jgi:hypothetical protein
VGRSALGDASKLASPSVDPGEDHLGCLALTVLGHSEQHRGSLQCPAEAPDWADAETWAVLRHDEPHTSAFWTVTLSCGHITDVVAPDLGWEPADGSGRVSASRLREMTTELEKFWAEQPTRATAARTRAHAKECSLEDGRDRAPSSCATPARGPGSSSRASASAVVDKGRSRWVAYPDRDASRHRPDLAPRCCRRLGLHGGTADGVTDPATLPCH